MSSQRLRSRSSNLFVFYVLPLAVLALLTVAARPQDAKPVNNNNDALSREVYHQLALLPHLTVFDNLAFKVDGDNVTLSGAVSQPINKSDAESAVKGIEGIGTATNNIKVLPLSPSDDQIRRAEFQAIYSFPSLQKYAPYAVRPIHIIVDGGHVTLEGAVDSQADKDTAGVRANGVPNVFSVDNHLQVSGATSASK
jgi:hyperosmotically inducible periplasmic protein